MEARQNSFMQGVVNHWNFLSKILLSLFKMDSKFKGIELYGVNAGEWCDVK